MNKIGIIGTGLIGTSLGIAIKRSILKDIEITGVDLEPSFSKQARKMGALDKVGRTMVEVARGSDILFICTPVMVIKDVLETVGGELKKGCLVTDTGGTKLEVMRWADMFLPDGVDFIGGHPMAGKESHGPGNAEPGIFEGKAYCVIPKTGASTQSVDALVKIIKSLGSTPFFIGAAEHDSFVAAVSHLPFIVAASLVNTTSNSPQWGDISKLASTGFRGTTRLASGDPIMHRDICLTNGDSIVHWLTQYVRQLEHIKELISSRDSNRLDELFETAFEKRGLWLSGLNFPESFPRKDVPSVPNFSQMLFGERIANKLFKAKGNQSKKDAG